MTVATIPMSILARQPAPQTMESSDVSFPVVAADREARRLAVLIGRGDEAAFRQLYDRYNGRLFRFALVLARGDESLAQDTVQAAFVTAAQKLRRAESEQHLWNWLARVARQHIAKAWRQRGKDSVLTGAETLPEIASDSTSDSRLEETLDAALLLMDAEERQLIEAFYFERVSHKEIAGQLNVTPKAVSSRLERAREKLRSLVKQKLSRET